jgi:hypothetical protein
MMLGAVRRGSLLGRTLAPSRGGRVLPLLPPRAMSTSTTPGGKEKPPLKPPVPPKPAPSGGLGAGRAFSMALIASGVLGAGYYYVLAGEDEKATIDATLERINPFAKPAEVAAVVVPALPKAAEVAVVEEAKPGEGDMVKEEMMYDEGAGKEESAPAPAEPTPAVEAVAAVAKVGAEGDENEARWCCWFGWE